MRLHRRILVVLASVVLVAAGCGDDDDDETTGAQDTTTTTEAPADTGNGTTTTADGAAAGGQAVEVGAVDYEFTDAPTELRAGVIDLTFTNDGEVAHEYGVAEIGDTPLDTFLADFPATLEGGPFPEYVGAVAVPATVEPGDTLETSFTLTEGTYAVFCTLDGTVPEEGATTTTAAAEGESGPRARRSAPRTSPSAWRRRWRSRPGTTPPRCPMTAGPSPRWTTASTSTSRPGTRP